ncbi:hypothetical protein [Spirosoma fluminis]
MQFQQPALPRIHREFEKRPRNSTNMAQQLGTYQSVPINLRI